MSRGGLQLGEFEAKDKSACGGSPQSTNMYFTTCPIHDHPRSSTPATEPFRFLDLPPEIRTRIASFVLTAPTTITIHQPQYNRHAPLGPEPMFLNSPRLDYPLPRTPPLTPPSEPSVLAFKVTQIDRKLKSRTKDGHSRIALLMACRRTYLDHWAAYYRSNTFSFTPNTWWSFRQKIPERCLQEIRHVHFRMPYRSRQMYVWRTLAELKSLQTITVMLAPPNLASRLERASCLAGARMCENLRNLKIERHDVGDQTPPPDDGQTSVAAKELKEDALVEKSINKRLEERQHSKFLHGKLGSSVTRKAPSREGSELRRDKRLRLMESPTPDERSMDEYFQIVESGTEDAEAEAQEL